MHYIPGQGTKKPLNMMQAPIYPDIKQGPPEFKWSRKYWTVDVGQTLLDTESNTQLREDAVLARSYRDNIDRYGQSSYQEKITVFRPPLQTSYEDFGPLNRIPVTTHAIQVRVNPGTVASDGGTTAYAVNNSAGPDLNKITDSKNISPSWRPTFFTPIDHPDDIVPTVLPDLVTVLPSHSTSSGYATNLYIDAPTSVDIRDSKSKPQTSAFSGSTPIYTSSLPLQTSTIIDLHDTTPLTSVSSGFTTYIIDGYNSSSELILPTKLPVYSSSSGTNNNILVEPQPTPIVELSRTLPSTSVSAGYSPFEAHSIDSYTSPNNYIKIKENPNVPVVAHQSFQYNSDNHYKKPQFQTKKIQPTKAYNSGLNSGTKKVAGIEDQRVGGRYFSNKQTYTPKMSMVK